MEDIEKSEELMALPWDMLDECEGLGLDSGGTMCKVVYIHKDDWLEPKDRKEPYGHMRCVCFPTHTHFAQSLHYLKERVLFRHKKGSQKPLIYTTGYGGSKFAKEIEDILLVSTVNITEIECFIQGFVYVLSNLQRGKHEVQIDPTFAKRSVDLARKNLHLMEHAMKDYFPAGTPPPKVDHSLEIPLEKPFNAEEQFTELDHVFPCFLAMAGSLGAVFCVQKDGSYETVSFLRTAGIFFQSLSSICTKTKSYDEQMARAERGNMHNVHLYISDMTGAAEKTDEQSPAVLFGKGRMNDNVEPDDLTRSLLFTTASLIVDTITNTIKFYPKVKHVFFCGGFSSHDLTRQFITSEMLRSDGNNITFGSKMFHDVHFMKYGQYLGALGTFLNQKLRFKTEESVLYDSFQK